MKIKYLYVSKYKNLKDLRLNFESDLISLLVGRNGLGKSNLIEILALIFRDLDLLEKEDDFKNWAYDPKHFEYEIAYECRGNKLYIKCKEGEFSVTLFRSPNPTGWETISFKEFRDRKREEFLPRYIIGYYSGDNKRIRNILRIYEEESWKNLKSNKDEGSGFRRMFFAENHHAQLVLLTLLLYRDNPPTDEFGEKVNRLIKEFATFKSLDEIQLYLKQPLWYNRKSKTQSIKSIELIESNILEGLETPFWNAGGRADRAISFFYNNNFGQPTYYLNPSDNIEYLELKSIDKEKVATLVKKEFGHPCNFLDAMEALYTIEAVKEIILNVSSESRQANFSFSSLSEGEQQLITVIGLLLITGGEESLYLFDEPDTHLNPAWQRNYVQLLRDFNLNDSNSHIIVATHSPLIVQAAEKADVFLFKKTGEGITALSEDNRINNWRIDQVLLSDYFDLSSTRPPQLDSFMKLREELLSKPSLSKDDIAALNNLEEEMGGILPTGETLNDVIAMQLIRSVADNIQKNDKNT